MQLKRTRINLAMILKFVYISIVLVVLSGCGNSSSNEVSAKEKIERYAQRGGDMPQVKDYMNVGISEVNSDNLDAVNNILLNLPSGEVKTIVEVKEVLDDFLHNAVSPSITLNGDQSMVLTQYTLYIELGAQATDDLDGNITNNIQIKGTVNTDKVGTYILTYSVRDTAGNETNMTRNVEVVLSEDNESTVGGITPDNNWTISYDHEEKASITKELDTEKNREVVYLNGNGIEASFSFGGSWNDTESNTIQWSMKTNVTFAVKVVINTDKGERIIQYQAKDTGKGLYKYTWTTIPYIIHGVGSNKVDGDWHIYTRNIQNDLKRYEPDNNLKSINGIRFDGKARFDNIILYSNTKNLVIDKPVVVSAPGIVLTFDDSYADNWSEMKDTFEQKGAVVTFFCNKWGSMEDGDLTPAEVAKFKALESDGHEIGYHTKDHLNTRDKKYDDSEDKAQAYFDDQIKDGVQNMRERGFEPESFSYPFVSGQPGHNKIIREELPHIREFFGHVEGIDRAKKSIEDIKKLLDKYKKDKEIGVFVGHWILPDNFKSNDTKYLYRTSKEKLIQLIDYAKKIGLRFYTLEEAHNIYLKQMKN